VALVGCVRLTQKGDSVGVNRCLHGPLTLPQSLFPLGSDTQGRTMKTITLNGTLLGFTLAGLAACGGGGDGAASVPAPAAQNGAVSLSLSDDSAEDWATIGVKLLSIALVPQGGGANVTVYTAPANAPLLNLAELDQISDVLASASVPAGTYTAAVLTISANPGDVLLAAAPDPETGFAGTAGATVDSGDIRVQGSRGAAGSLSSSVTVNLETPLVVAAGGTVPLDLEFALDHPVFIVGHTALGGVTKWAVDFDGPLRHRRIADVTRLVLRHLYGQVASVASDNASITVTKELPRLPVTSTEAPVSTGTSLRILVDATNGTIFRDLDAGTSAVIKDFSQQAASLVGKQLRIAARYQSNGTLVATRLWASTDFAKIRVSPEGHVLHVDIANSRIVVANEAGRPVPVTINASTEFVVGGTTVGTGTAFLANQQLLRGFKVQVSVVDPLALPLVAQTVEIQSAVYDGVIAGADSLGFNYQRNFRTSNDDYQMHLAYIASSAPNGKDANGTAITGFKYWNFAYPTLVTSGSNAIPDFVTTTTGSVNLGGAIGALKVAGATHAQWGDGASNASGWYAPWSILMPRKLPLGSVATGIVNGQFTADILGGTIPATVKLGTTAGSATPVYQVDRTGGVLTVSPVDIGTASGLATLTTALTVSTKLKVTGVPQADGTLRAYTLTYFTGDAPIN